MAVLVPVTILTPIPSQWQAVLPWPPRRCPTGLVNADRCSVSHCGCDFYRHRMLVAPPDAWADSAVAQAAHHSVSPLGPVDRRALHGHWRHHLPRLEADYSGLPLSGLSHLLG